MEYTLTLRRQKCYKSFERMTDTESGVPSKPPQHIQLSIYIRNRSEPIDKCPNSTLGSHTVLNDRHQDQLAKCPNSTSCSKEKFAGCTAVYLLDLGPCQLVQMHLSVLLWEGGSWQSVPSRRETGRDPKTNDFGNSEERAPRASSWVRQHPAWQFQWQLYLENPVEPDLARAQRRIGAKNCYHRKVGIAAAPRSKAI